MKPGRKYLLVPAAGHGDGMGHLTRCLRLAGSLVQVPRGAPRPRVSFLATRMDAASRKLLGSSAPRGAEVLLSVKPGSRWDLIVLDGRSTRPSELRALQETGPVVCLDEGGEARKLASFLIDAIPTRDGPANLSSLSFLDLPARSRRRVRWPPRRVLVSFGGEDREDLSTRVLDALLADGLFPPSRITVTEGPLFAPRSWPSGVTVMRGVQRLSELLGSFDVVFTHFGITALEALASGVPAVLLNPSSYHDRLGREAGIPRIGVGRPAPRALRRILADGRSAQAVVDAFGGNMGARAGWRLPEALKGMRPKGTPRCSVCGRDRNPVIGRFPDRTYRTCRGCGVTYLESFAAQDMEYGARYFNAQYKAQYGRTYREDFEAIKAASVERLRIIHSLVRADLPGSLVDVGCAYGPFLAAARDQGRAGFGIDVSPHAVAYVSKKLGIPALCSSFEDARRQDLPRRISAVTFWYVIEHFVDVGLVLDKASALLPAGGVLAFSTPNGRGISARKDLGRFLENSPPDHFTIFSARGLRRLLAARGLELRRIRVTGHHPERFPGLLGKAARASRQAAGTLGLVSRLLRLGDTFEAYAVKAGRP